MTKQNKVLATLKTARALITKRENWTQGAYARDADGNLTIVGACSFCAVGAICRVSNNVEAEIESNVALGRTTLYLDGMGVASYNDSHTHAEVLAAFDMTIARLESGYVKEVT